MATFSLAKEMVFYTPQLFIIILVTLLFHAVKMLDNDRYTEVSGDVKKVWTKLQFKIQV